MMVSGIITLTTDFGLKDPYVAIMKGVILSINPEARIIDISHQVNAGSIIHAASLVEETCRFFPAGTIHVAVVDPGVGGRRRPILFQAESHFFVGPDNGLFWPIISNYQDGRIIHLTESRYFLPYVGNTFHGRDIFAPVAAHLSKGVDPITMGSIVNDPVSFKMPAPQQREGILYGQVIRVDNFGNLITNIRRRHLKAFAGTGQPIIHFENLVIEGLENTYSETTPGDLLALFGSSGYLEIAVNQGRACDGTGLDCEGIIGVEVKIQAQKFRL